MKTYKGAFTGEKRWLSNMYKVQITVDRSHSLVDEYADIFGLQDGMVFNSSENLYMFCKSDDPVFRKECLTSSNPHHIKSISRKVALRDNWHEKYRIPAMKIAVLLKFCGNDSLATKLVATNDEHIEEKNNWGDTFWGTVDGKGFNALGQVLMWCREICMQEKEKREQKHFVWNMNPQDPLSNKGLFRFLLSKEPNKTLTLRSQDLLVTSSLLETFYIRNEEVAYCKGIEVNILDEKAYVIFPTASVFHDYGFTKPSKIIVDGVFYNEANKCSMVDLCKKHGISLEISIS